MMTGLMKTIQTALLFLLISLQVSAGDYHSGPQINFKASFRTYGELLKGKELKGTFYVGKHSARLDLPDHPNARHAVHIIAANGELWRVDMVDMEYQRLGKGDWETKIFPTVLNDKDIKNAVEGKCPFGWANAKKCSLQGEEKMGGRQVEKWRYKKKTIWLDPELRISLKERFKPFFRNEKTQTSEVTSIKIANQSEQLFLIPGGLTCNSGTFCNDAPVTP